ncbi:DMT family protein [Maribellus sediminis]|uniref:DMT family protein n=1 Tax=Maribellus sediminis TaxID=2696285 RepID=UPI0030B832A0
MILFDSFAKIFLQIMKGISTVVLLVLSNTFMTFAWYGHLKFAELKWFNKLGLFSIVLISWGIALFEYKLSK